MTAARLGPVVQQCQALTQALAGLLALEAAPGERVVALGCPRVWHIWTVHPGAYVIFRLVNVGLDAKKTQTAERPVSAVPTVFVKKRRSVRARPIVVRARPVIANGVVSQWSGIRASHRFNARRQNTVTSVAGSVELGPSSVAHVGQMMLATRERFVWGQPSRVAATAARRVIVREDVRVAAT